MKGRVSTGGRLSAWLDEGFRPLAEYRLKSFFHETLCLEARFAAGEDDFRQTTALFAVDEDEVVARSIQ